MIIRHKIEQCTYMLSFFCEIFVSFEMVCMPNCKELILFFPWICVWYRWECNSICVLLAIWSMSPHSDPAWCRIYKSICILGVLLVRYRPVWRLGRFTVIKNCCHIDLFWQIRPVIKTPFAKWWNGKMKPILILYKNHIDIIFFYNNKYIYFSYINRF